MFDSVALLTTSRWQAAVGMVMVVVGAFLSDQATHLAQMDHADPPPTWIEEQQQQRRVTFVLIGLAIVAAGTWFAFYVPAR